MNKPSSGAKGNTSDPTLRMMELALFGAMAKKGLDYEVLAAFDKNGKFLETVVGSAGSVPVPMRLMVQALDVTHNHPGGERNFGGTLSPDDLKTFGSSNWSSIRAIAEGQGAGLYILKKGPNAQDKEYKALISRMSETLQKSTDRVYSQVFNSEMQKAFNAASHNIKAWNIPKSIAKAKHIAAQKANGIMHEFLKSTAPLYGFHYIKRKRPYRNVKSMEDLR